MKKIYENTQDVAEHSIFIMALAFGLVLLYCLTPGWSRADVSPKVFGVTSHSVYKEYVKPRWYDPDATATLSINAGVPVAFSNGTKISNSGQYELVVSSLFGQTTVSFEIDTTVSSAIIQTNAEQVAPQLEIRFAANRYVATPVFAIWAENIHGNFLQSLYVSAVPATNIMRFTNNDVRRPQAVPYWAHKACEEKSYGMDMLFLAEPDLPVPENLDAVSGATQKSAFTLNTTVRTNEINDSRIRIFFEINQSFDDGWYFYGGNSTREEDGIGTFSSDKFFSGSEEPAIVYCVEIDLNQSQTWLLGGNDGESEALPVGYSHYGGRTGLLYTDFYADDGGIQRYKFDHAHEMVGLMTVDTFPEISPIYTGDFDKDGDVDGIDIGVLANRSDLIVLYLAQVAASFGGN